MIIKKGMRVEECELLQATLIASNYADGTNITLIEQGTHITLTEQGEMVLVTAGAGFRKYEIDSFENRSISFHLLALDLKFPTLLLSGAINAELSFNPALYVDDRYKKFLQKKEVVIPCVMVDTKTEKVVGVREMIMSKEVKLMVNMVFGYIYELDLPQEEFLKRYYNTYYAYSVNQLLQMSKVFGVDKTSRACREIELPDYSLIREIEIRFGTDNP